MKAERPPTTTETEGPRNEAEISLSVEPVFFNNTRPHVGGEAMSVKAERPLKDAIKATFVEVPRNGMASVGPWMARVRAAPKKLDAEAARMPDRPGWL